MNKLALINTAISLSLTLLIGLLSGYNLAYFRIQAAEFPNLKFTDDINPGVATIKLLEISGNKLKGEVVGAKTRLIYSYDGILEVGKDESFEIPLSEIDLIAQYRQYNIPKDALFAASKSGKYYYSVFDKRTYNLSEKNRLFFSSSIEAEAAGYLAR